MITLADRLAKAKEKIRNGCDEKAYSEMCIPKRYWGKLPEKDTLYMNAQHAVLKGKSFVITGAVGSGKTQLAIALMLEWFAENITEEMLTRNILSKTPLFLPAGEFFLELKEGFSKNLPEKEILDKYNRPSLLTIDDIGAEKITDWSRYMFYILIDRRYRECKQVIITTNLSFKEFAGIDDRIASRLVEMGEIIKLEDQDRRVVKD